MIKTLKKRNRGFTLVELIVAVAVFIVAMDVLTTTFISLGKTQRRQKDVQMLQGDVQSFFETLDREVRTGYGETFSTGTNSLFFRNQNGNCVTYYLSDGKMHRSEDSTATGSCAENTSGTVLTSSRNVFSDISFSATSSGVDTSQTPPILSSQGFVQLSFKACINAATPSNCMVVQTSITSRQLSSYVSP